MRDTVSRIYKGSELVYSAPDTKELTAFLTGLVAGDRIELFRAANIRTDAVISTDTFKGVNMNGARGTIVSGPKTGILNSIWYEINFDTGHDGWCVSDNYTKISSTTVQTTPSYFKVGDKVKLYRAANSRSSAAIANNLLGVVPEGATGTITVGPTKNGTINWYKIDFDTATHKDGYVASDNYVKMAPVAEDDSDWITGSCSGPVPNNGKIINVGPGGNIEAAISKASPGDTIVVANGTYNDKIFIGEGSSGNANGWITIKSATRYGAKLTKAITLYKADYIRIEGFDLVGQVGAQAGIGANGCHHLQVINNRLSVGLIFAGVSDFILIEGNIVHGNVGGFNQIEVLYPQNITGDTTTRNRIIVRNNVSYDNNRPQGTDGSGIMIDCFSLTRSGDYERKYVLNLLRAPMKPYTYGAIVDNNICYDNNGPGIYINFSDFISITNNICFNNNARAGNGSTWSGNILMVSSRNNVVKDNVFVTLGTKTSYAISCQSYKYRPSENNTWTGNTTFDKSKSGNASLAVVNTCPVPAATNKLGQGSQYTTRPTTFLKPTCN